MFRVRIIFRMQRALALAHWQLRRDEVLRAVLRSRYFVYEVTLPSPFREEHDHFRNTVRQFAAKELAPYADEWEKAELFPN